MMNAGGLFCIIELFKKNVVYGVILQVDYGRHLGHITAMIHWQLLFMLVEVVVVVLSPL